MTRLLDLDSTPSHTITSAPLASPALDVPQWQQMGYRAEVDGLRAIAVLSVMLHHAGLALFDGGFIGVDVFFVISGYLITRILLTEWAQGRFSLLQFYERRVRRILPALFFMLVMCMFMSMIFLWPADNKSFSRSLAGTAISISNVIFWRESGYFDSSASFKPLLHTWSLSVEEQFYLIFPLGLMIILRWQRALTPWLLGLIALFSLGLAQWLVHRHPMMAFFLLPGRAWELLLGSLLAWRHQHQDASGAREKQLGSLLGMGLIVWAILTFDQNTPFPGLAALLPTAGAILIIHYAQPGTWVHQLLCQPILVGIGLISYSAYLWHQPLLVFSRHYLQAEPGPIWITGILLATLLVAYFSWRYIERPLRKSGNMSRSHALGLALTGSILFFGAGMLGYHSEGFSRFYPAQVQALQHIHQNPNTPDHCWRRLSQDQNFDHACHLGTPGQPPSFVLLGDSHAGSLSAALDQASRAQHLAGLDFSFRSCLPVIHSTYQAKDATARTCSALRQLFFAPNQLASWPETVILVGRWTLAMERHRPNNGEGGQEPGGDYTLESQRTASEGYTRALAQDYADTVHTLLKSGKKVILVYPIPEMAWDVPQRLAQLYMRHGRLQPDDASVSVQYIKQRNQRAEAALDAIGEQPGLSRVRPSNILCHRAIKDRCVAHTAGAPVYFDNNHLSITGAKPIVDAITQQLVAEKH